MIRIVAALLALAAACTTPQPCPSPLEECGGQCVDVSSDRRNCGTCGTFCAPGNVCSGGRCTTDPLAPCFARTGGAFVTLGVCDAAVKFWTRDAAFLDAATERLGAVPDPRFVPSLAVIARTDCDAQWSWTLADSGGSFVPQDAIDPGLACSVCPAAIQADVAGGSAPSRTWCPASAAVLAVDRRVPPP
jgi:hypothetical protein